MPALNWTCFVKLKLLSLEALLPHHNDLHCVLFQEAQPSRKSHLGGAPSRGVSAPPEDRGRAGPPLPGRARALPAFSPQTAPNLRPRWLQGRTKRPAPGTGCEGVATVRPPPASSQASGTEETALCASPQHSRSHSKGRGPGRSVLQGV